MNLSAPNAEARYGTGASDKHWCMISMVKGIVLSIASGDVQSSVKIDKRSPHSLRQVHPSMLAFAWQTSSWEVRSAAAENPETECKYISVTGSQK
jgi:hypothetical protein